MSITAPNSLGGYPSPTGEVPLPVVPSGPAPGAVTDWRGELLRQLVLADRRSVKLDRTTLMQAVAQADTAEQVVAGLVGMFTEDER